MDDLKLCGTSDNQLNGLISTVKKVSDDIQMELGLDKCAKATFKRGNKVSAEGILLNDHQLIQDLDQAETYKYLGMEEGEGVQHHQLKVKIKKEYKWQIKLVLNSELNARNRIAAINTLAVPVVLYSYGIIDWKLNEIQDLHKMTRKQLCKNRTLAKKADVDRIHLPCQEGGRSLMNLEKGYKATMVGLHKYYSTLGESMAAQITQSHYDIDHYLSKIPRNLSSLVMSLTSIEDIEKIIHELPNKSSHGHDTISNILLKKLNTSISYPLKLIFNQSITQGMFPESMKLVEVIPTYKGKCMDFVENYRPISLLITISKVLEKIIYTRVYNYIEKHKILFNSQYGFRNKHSCKQTLIELTG